MKIRPQKALTFDDVLLVPKRSPFRSRKDVSTASRLTNSITLNMPILSANMDTVTESEMAIAMARTGAVGVLHRFMSTEKMVRHVKRVKRAEGFLVDAPYTIGVEANLAQVERTMQYHEVGGLMVVDADGTMVGLVTRRDILLAPDSSASVQSVMTPPDSIITATADVTIDEARALLHQHRLEKLPVVGEDGALVGLITAQDVMQRQGTTNSTKDSRGRLRVGAAIGVQSHDIERAGALLDAGCDFLVLDIAHGHADHCIDMIKALKANHKDVQIVAGNVATREGARELTEAGADAIKVGIGPGSICTTRIVTGFGVPQLTAIMDSYQGIVDTGANIPLIADGGIKTSGDMVKALAAGADTVMIGSMFAGCEEAPGAPVVRDGQKVKIVRGMASLGAAIGRKKAESEEVTPKDGDDDWNKVVPEGVEAVVPYRGNVSEIVYQMVGGLRSGLSYAGAATIAQLHENAEFIEMTAAGVRESNSHDVKRV